MIELDAYFDWIVDNNIASVSELTLVTNINGYNVETLDSVVCVRTGYHSIQQIYDVDRLSYIWHNLSDDDIAELEG